MALRQNRRKMKAPDKTNEELCVLAQQGDEDAADQLVRQCLPFIRQQANRLWIRMGLQERTAVIDQEDLVQEGCIGLLHAIPVFDSTLEMKFLTFAGKLIYRSMLNAIVAVMTCFEIAVQRNGRSLQNLNAPIRDEERMTLEETIADTSVLSPEQRAVKTEVLRELYFGIDQLPERERSYVLYRYGFLDSEEHTLTETARHFHLSESRAKGIEENALARLRAAMPHRFFVNGQLISGDVFQKTILSLFEKRDRGQFL